MLSAVLQLLKPTFLLKEKENAILDYDKIKEKLNSRRCTKYDVSCSSSGGNRKTRIRTWRFVSSGICHTYTEDGRCVVIKNSVDKFLYLRLCPGVTRKVMYSARRFYSRRSRWPSILPKKLYRRTFLSSEFFKKCRLYRNVWFVWQKIRLEHNFNGYSLEKYSWC
jgi:predicted DNA-binding helix-hairpin-helix protein